MNLNPVLSCLDTLPSLDVVFLHITQCVKGLTASQALKGEVKHCASLALKKRLDVSMSASTMTRTAVCTVNVLV